MFELFYYLIFYNQFFLNHSIDDCCHHYNTKYDIKKHGLIYGQIGQKMTRYDKSDMSGSMFGEYVCTIKALASFASALTSFFTKSLVFCKCLTFYIRFFLLGFLGEFSIQLKFRIVFGFFQDNFDFVFQHLVFQLGVAIIGGCMAMVHGVCVVWMCIPIELTRSQAP